MTIIHRLAKVAKQRERFRRFKIFAKATVLKYCLNLQLPPSKRAIKKENPMYKIETITKRIAKEKTLLKLSSIAISLYSSISKIGLSPTIEAIPPKKRISMPSIVALFLFAMSAIDFDLKGSTCKLI